MCLTLKDKNIRTLRKCKISHWKVTSHQTSDLVKGSIKKFNYKLYIFLFHRVVHRKFKKLFKTSFMPIFPKSTGAYKLDSTLFKLKGLKCHKCRQKGFQKPLIPKLQSFQKLLGLTIFHRFLHKISGKFW